VRQFNGGEELEFSALEKGSNAGPFPACSLHGDPAPALSNLTTNMLRISELTPHSASARLRFEGRLVGPWVIEATQVCNHQLNRISALELDLADLVYLDRNGASLLTQLRARGVSLVNSSPFIEEQLKAFTSASPLPSSSHKREFAA
jgi:hypothetical protein